MLIKLLIGVLTIGVCWTHAFFDRSGARQLTDLEARVQLTDTGISVNKPEPVTSLENVRQATISGIIQFKRSSGCTVVVTGGTESGHASGKISHGTGYKLDIRLNECVNTYIKSNYPNIGKRRSDGAPQFKSPNDYTFALEKDHWDIVFP